MKRSKNEECPFLRLPEKLIIEILCRLPVKSLGKCKLVCKSWNTLISDPEFAMSHVEFSKSNNQPLTLILQKNNILSQLKFRDSTDISRGVTLAPLRHRFLEDDVFDPRCCFIVGSCDGLICVYVKEMGKKRRRDDSMSLWNPCTTEELEISLPVERGSFYVHIESSWFGCVPSCDDDYKIFLVYTMHKQSHGTCMYLYSLRFDRWKSLYVSDEDYERISEVDSVYLDEALHYLVRRKWIVIFDLVSETFKKVPFSIDEADKLPNYHQLSLGVIGEYDCLCAMFVHHSEEWMVELWTLEEYDDWDSWEKMYRIELKENIVINCMKFLGFTYSGNLCIQQANGLVLVDTDDDPPSHVVARNPSFEKVYKVMDYVESLVSPDSIS
ncbi:F-box/kelch-repeat protein At3g06240-like [Chenopodium quinoa]|uniref:F-box domain-containing protein n=1 Tax=Chenopodium quinoa TaxID=63459 RepID=A0A803LBN3_CHEQI|nr:F-box/kelch-repeat protein At3g06240-like [Chenopodium quinoa]